MATTIKLKNGSGAPAASDLVQGEPAIDLTNKRLYTEDSGGSVIEVGTNPSSLSIDGTAVTATATEINTLDGITSTTAELNILDGVTATAAELNVLDGVTAFVDEDDMVSNSATAIPSQQSVKAYVDSTVTAQDLDFQGDSGGALSIDLDSETLTIAGGTGIDTSGATNTLTVAIDSTVATLTGSQTLTNKTLTTPVISSISNTGTLTLPTSTDTLVGRDTTDTLTNKTLTSPVLNTGVSGTAILDEDDMASDSATQLATQQSIKAYVDSQVASADTLAELTDTNITTPADGALLFYDTTTSKWIDNVVSGDITIADTGVAAISSGVIVNDDINASAAISVSKTALVDGTGLTLTGDTLSVDASQTQITAVGTIGTGTWQGSVITNTYVADDLTINGGTIENTPIGAATPNTGEFTTLTVSGDLTVDTDTLYVDSTNNRVGIGDLAPSERLVVSRLGTNWAGVAPQAITTALFHSGTTNDSSGSAITIAGGDTATNAVYFSNESDNDVGAVIYSNSDDSMQFRANNSERMIIDSSGNVGIGDSTPDAGLTVHKNAGAVIANSNIARQTYTSVGQLQVSTSAGGGILVHTEDNTASGFLGFGDGAVAGRIEYAHSSDKMSFMTGSSPNRMILDSTGNLLVGRTSVGSSGTGHSIRGGDSAVFSVSGGEAVQVVRNTNDGNLIQFFQDGVEEGTISVSGTTVSYNGGHLSRWSQTPDNTRIELLKGTVMTNLDQMAVWGDEDNEQLNCMEVSSVEGDPNVAGVFVNWDDDDTDYVNDMNVAMTGDMIIRIAQGATVQRGDLLMSAGDGTAKPQEDDIVRSKTVAKVTSTHVTCTYADGSYCVPCVLMAC